MIPGAVVDPVTGLLQIPKSSLDNIPDITFELAGTDSPLVFNRFAQLFDPSVQGTFGLSSEYYYSWIVDLGRSTDGSSYDFILGARIAHRATHTAFLLTLVCRSKIPRAVLQRLRQLQLARWLFAHR